MPVAGRPLVAWSLAALGACEAVGAVVVAAPPGWRDGESSDAEGPARLREWLGGEEGAEAPPLSVVDGGATRAESVSNAVAEVGTEVVAIHDAARPLVTAALLEALVDELEAEPDADAVIAAAPVTDTVKREEPASMRQLASYGNGNRRIVAETLDRSALWAAQTPQVFRTAALRRALAVDAATRDAATDEAMLVEAAGGTVLLHAVGGPNLKVTTPEDLRIAALLLGAGA